MRKRKNVNYNKVMGKILRCTDIYRYIVIGKIRPIEGIRALSLGDNRIILVSYLDKADNTIVNYYWGDCSTEKGIDECVKQINKRLKEAGWR